MDARQIELDCETISAAAQDAMKWLVAPNASKLVGQDYQNTETSLRRVSNEVRRLRASLNRPKAVGVFGPSQAGKSYLVSVLARKSHEPLIALFDGDRPELDFIRDINPPTGEETTGLVTRFSLAKPSTPEGFPVCLRLLSQCDVIKILVNSYFHDGDQEYEDVPTQEAITAHLDEFAGRTAAASSSLFVEEDIWDVKDYVSKNSSGASTARALESAWGRIALIAPKLSVNDLPPFFSILWGSHSTYTALCSCLFEALSALGFVSDLYCPLDALLPSTKSVLDVKTLGGILSKDQELLIVRTIKTGSVQLPRPIVTALASELRVTCRDEPHAFFSHTDLLDFPGYRSRTKHHLSKYFKDAAEIAPKELFLRGKVDYLFQRYTADLELTGMALCLPDSNLEVSTLPRAVESWIDVTHGDTPQKRAGKPTLLFFVLTKFDRHLMESAGDEGNDPKTRFEIRVNASLLSPFGKGDGTWARNWTPDQAFNNTFWIRNPNFKSEHVIEYDGRKEVCIISARADRIAQLRTAFVNSKLVQTHFMDPVSAWDEVMKLNDGGVSYLVRALSEVCTPDLKLRQIKSRLDNIRRDVREVLGRFYVHDDYTQRKVSRLRVVDDRIFPDLNVCAEKQAFGSVLRGLMVDALDLQDALTAAINRPRESSVVGDAKANLPRRGGIFTGIIKPDQPSQPQTDKSVRISLAALSCWSSLMARHAEDPAFARRVGVGSEALKEIVAELSAAARRHGLANRISDCIRDRSSPIDSPDTLSRKSSVIAERIINRFVSELDFDRMDLNAQAQKFGIDLIDPVFLQRDTTFDAEGMTSEPSEFVVNFMVSWGKAFRATVAQNAMLIEGSTHDVELNSLLGRIIMALA